MASMAVTGGDGSSWDVIGEYGVQPFPPSECLVNGITTSGLINILRTNKYKAFAITYYIPFSQGQSTGTSFTSDILILSTDAYINSYNPNYYLGTSDYQIVGETAPTSAIQSGKKNRIVVTRTNNAATKVIIYGIK